MLVRRHPFARRNASNIAPIQPSGTTETVDRSHRVQTTRRHRWVANTSWSTGREQVGHALECVRPSYRFLSKHHDLVAHDHGGHGRLDLIVRHEGLKQNQAPRLSFEVNIRFVCQLAGLHSSHEFGGLDGPDLQ